MSTDIVPIVDAFISVLEQLGVSSKARRDMGDSAECFLSSLKERQHFQDLINTAVKHLGRAPSLLRKLNLILKSIRSHVIVVHDPVAESATLFVVRTSREAFVISIGSSDSEVQVVRDSHSLRSALQSAKLEELPQNVVDPPSPIWASVLMEILLFEMRDFPVLYEEGHVDESYRGRCMRCLQCLSTKFASLPPSYFIDDAITESKHSVAGGGFADILEGRLDGGLVCLKVLRFPTSTTEETQNLVKTLYREALCWGPLDHPNILSFLGVNEQIEPYRSFCLISPWMDNGNLMSFLEKNPDFDRLKAVIDTAEGMRYLHELDPPIIHADIRGANILVTKELRCCLANFGLAAATEMVITSVRNDDTLPWMAPEILQEIPPGTTTSSTRDIFAFGCTMLEIFTGKRPFDGVPMPAVFLKVMNGERPSRPGAGSSAQEISDETWAVISSCWRQEAAERPSARQALRDLGVPLSLNYTILRRPDPQLSVEALFDKLRSEREYLLQLMPINGENPSQEFLRIVGEELRSIEAYLNIYDTTLSRFFDLHTALASNIRNPVPRLIKGGNPKLPILVRYQKYQSDRDYLCRLLAIHTQTPRKAFLDRIYGELELVQGLLFVLADRKVNDLLNKLTVEMFDSISDQIIEWANQSEKEKDGRTLFQVIRLVFKKATNDAAWSELYARLCRKMMEQISPKVQDDGIKNAEGKPIAGGQLFRKYLLNRCQEDFERGWVAKQATPAAAATKAIESPAEVEASGEANHGTVLYSDKSYAAQKAKRQGLGLIKFIGELFKVQMLTERIMHECVKKLLGNVENPEEEEIESLCKLISTVGLLLDTPKARAHMDVYFSRMEALSKSDKINSRLQVILKDVIELRDRKWVSRTVVAAPTTIAAVHEAAAKERAVQEKESYKHQMGMSRGKFQAGPNGWNVASGNAPRPPPKAGDLSNFGKIKSTSKGLPTTVGPSSVFSGKKDNKREAISQTSSSQNMFSMLSHTPEAPANTSSKDIAAPEVPTQRRRLILLPRSKPTTEERSSTTAEATPAGSDRSSEKEATAKMSEEDTNKKIGEN